MTTPEEERQEELHKTCCEESKAYPDETVIAFIGHLFKDKKPPAHLVSAASGLDKEHKKKLAFEMMQRLVASDLSEDEDGCVSERVKVESGFVGKRAKVER
jgi:hypothetical protein